MTPFRGLITVNEAQPPPKVHNVLMDVASWRLVLLCSIAILLNAACFRFSVCLQPFN